MFRADALTCVEKLKSEDRITVQDDRDFWVVALHHLMHEAAVEIESGQERPIWIQLGVCSHWLRPHQTRWTADGGFAYPSGYSERTDGRSYNEEALPEFDWFSCLSWSRQTKQWEMLPPATRQPQRVLMLRIVVPARTARHQQAVVHTIWQPGTPESTRRKRTRFYGFRRLENGWELRATAEYPKEKTA